LVAIAVYPFSKGHTSHKEFNTPSQCAKLRPYTTRLSDPAQAAKMTLRSLAKRIETLEEKIAVLDGQLDPLVKQTAPTLLTRIGIGTQHTAQLLITAGENIGRLHSEAAFARLCGVAPFRSPPDTPIECDFTEVVIVKLTVRCT